MRPVCVTLALPPSVNNALVIQRGRLAKSGKARAWRRDAERCLWMLPRPEPFVGPVELRVDFYVQTLSSDCSNRIKPLEDLLSGWAYLDDRQVADVRAVKHLVGEDGTTEPCAAVCVWLAPNEKHPELAKRLAQAERRVARKSPKGRQKVAGMSPATYRPR